MFRLYLEKLHPDCTSLWQKPRQGQVFYIDPEWYEPRVVGRDMCECFMKLSLVKSVTLDCDYKNHSIRSTVISTLDCDGFEARHIIQLSSHKSKSTVKEYSTKCPDNKRKEMFQSLTNTMTLPPHPQKIKASATTTLPSLKTQNSDANELIDIDHIKNNLPTLEFEEIDQFAMIDDQLLVDIMNQTLDKENLNTNLNNNNTTEQPISENANPIVNIAQPQNPNLQQQINTQVINNSIPFSNNN